MNWDDVRVFLAVARHESLSAAGRPLRMDPATVGRRVSRLEAAVGAALFEKSPRGYSPTEAGLRMLGRAEEAERAFVGAAEEAKGPGGAMSGQIRIAAPDGCAVFLLPQVCGTIAAENPELDIQVVSLSRVANLSKREADLAITVSPPVSGRLTVRKIRDYGLHLAAMPDYLKDAPPLRDLSDLGRHRVVGYVPEMIYDSELDYLADLGIEMPAFSSNSVAVQFAALARGLGIGIVHGFAMGQAPGMLKVFADRFTLKRSYFLVRHADDRKVDGLNRFAGRLVELLGAEIAEQEARAGARPED